MSLLSAKNSPFQGGAKDVGGSFGGVHAHKNLQSREQRSGNGCENG